MERIFTFKILLIFSKTFAFAKLEIINSDIWDQDYLRIELAALY